MTIKNDCGCNCEEAQYIDGIFVCKITGEKCIYQIPNQYGCYKIYEKNRNKK